MAARSLAGVRQAMMARLGLLAHGHVGAELDAPAVRRPALAHAKPAAVGEPELAVAGGLPLLPQPPMIIGPVIQNHLSSAGSSCILRVRMIGS